MSQQERSKIDLSVGKMSANWPKVGYPESAKSFYNKQEGQVKDKDSMFSGKKLADIFIFSMVLGKNAGLMKEYEKKADRNDNIDFEYIARNPDYVWLMISIAIEEAIKKGEDALEIFAQPKEKIIDVCEKYANFGIKLLIDLDNKASAADPLIGYEELMEELLEKNE